tara:strand:- start:49754 stop:50431 length:678 start_codon:yes stop_codon:yes gene_type:complete
MKFTKKPITIEAVRFTGINADGDATFEGTLIPGWIGEAMACAPGAVGSAWVEHEAPAVGFMIGTLEGHHHVSTGDWIIRGVKGEIYPCKPDIFEATYSPANDYHASLTKSETIKSDPVDYEAMADEREKIPFLPVPDELTAILGAIMVAKQEFEDLGNRALVADDLTEKDGRHLQTIALMMESALDNWMNANMEHGDIEALKAQTAPGDKVFVIGEGFVPADQVE